MDMRETGAGDHDRPLARAVPRLILLACVIGPIYYIAVTTVLGLLWEGYDPIRQTQSELGSVGAPHAAVMNVAAFMALGVVILAFAIAYATSVRGCMWTWLAVAALAFAGTGMVLVGFFPCDPGCVDVTPAGELHGTFSMPGAIGLPVAAMLSGPAFRRDGRFGPRWQVASFAIGALALASGPVIQAQLLPDVAGLLQRVAMWTPTAWMSLVSLRFVVVRWE